MTKKRTEWHKRSVKNYLDYLEAIGITREDLVKYRKLRDIVLNTAGPNVPTQAMLDIANRWRWRFKKHFVQVQIKKGAQLTMPKDDNFGDNASFNTSLPLQALSFRPKGDRVTCALWHPFRGLLLVNVKTKNVMSGLRDDVLSNSKENGVVPNNGLPYVEEIYRRIPDWTHGSNLWTMMQHCTVPAYTTGASQGQVQLFPGKTNLFPPIDDVVILNDFIQIMMFCSTGGNVPDRWAKLSFDDVKDDAVFKKQNETNEACRSYKVKPKNVQSSRTTKATPPRGGRSSSGGDNALDNALLIKFGCFFALITIVKMFLRKCRKKPRWGIFGR